MMPKKHNPWLLDVPVVFQLWIRPQLTAQQFAQIAKARPSKLYIVSDGGRNDEEWGKIQQSRALVETIDWDCTVTRLYLDDNQGMYATMHYWLSYVFDHAKEAACIFMEDDIIPSVSFFRYCADLLYRYQDDLRIQAISGINALGCCEEMQADYFFASVGSVWGCAFWKRTYDNFKNLGYLKDDYAVRCSVDALLPDYTERQQVMRTYAAIRDGRLVDGKHPPGLEFFLVAHAVSQNQLWINPKKNLTSCFGAGDDAEHNVDLKKLPKAARRRFNQPVYELGPSIIHPSAVVRDIRYEKNVKKLYAVGRPMVRAWRRFVGVLMQIRYGDFSKLCKKAYTRFFCRETVVEK